MIGLAPIPFRRLIWTTTAWCFRTGWTKLGEGFDDLFFPRICPVCDGDADYWGFCPPAGPNSWTPPGRSAPAARCRSARTRW